MVVVVGVGGATNYKNSLGPETLFRKPLALSMIPIKGAL
jgi:hypothetical protein